MQILKETSGPQTIYKLKEAELGETLGEAVVSQTEKEYRLHGIFVKQAFRGKGYGKLIMNTFLGEAQAKRVTLSTGFGNIAFFSRFGFEVVDVGDSLISMEKKPGRGRFLAAES